MIVSTCSMNIGQASTQARQVVQDHSVSGAISPPITGASVWGRPCTGSRPGWPAPA
ncbi:hypothetical protein [Ponticoccus litoralis]|uniref:Uncharacterized protein n=1 Tax=Ponticoccus litoralis TaxID=422297 RepID=A0AAW9SU63_9RHOB